MEKYYENIPFEDLYRVKGESGLFILCIPVNKSGMCGVISLSDIDSDVAKEKWVKSDKMFCLADYLAITYQGHGNLELSDIFNNIYNFGFDRLKEMCIDEILDVLVPEYDEEKFKSYHAMSILTWYEEINNKFEEIENGVS